MRVLVTRPEPGASKTAARLAALGHTPVVLPLTEVVGLPIRIADLPQADIVAVTSANALRYTPRALLPAFTTRPLFAVGAETAKIARAAGWENVVEGPGNAAGLSQTIRTHVEAGSSVLYLCGQVRLPDFENTMSQAGFTVHAVETYAASPIPYAVDDPGKLAGTPVDAVLLYSAFAAETFVGLASREALLQKDTRLVCLSERVAVALGSVARQNVVISARPDEDSLLAAL